MADFGDEIIIKDPTGKFKIFRGGKFYDWEAPVKKSAALLPPALVEKILKQGGLHVEKDLEPRLAEIVEAYQKDVRDRFETKSALVRKVEVGGMGFSSEQADLVIKLIEEIKGVEEVKEIKKVEVRPRIAPEVALPAAVPEVAVIPPIPTREVPPGVALFVFSPADEAEIAAHQQKLPKLIAGLKPVEVAKLIREILQESGLVLPDEGRKKLENILLTHFKDVRDGYETKETLSRAVNFVGVSLIPEQIEKLLTVTKNKLQKLEDKQKQDELGKIKKAMEEERAMEEGGREKVSEGVRAKIEERWRQITKKQTASPLALSPELVAPPASLWVGAAEAAKVERAPIVGVTAKVEETPKPLEIFKTVASVRRPIPQKEGRPRLEDIKYVPKLVGPVEELREMTLVDFRRLSADPREAVEIIKEKLKLLEKESITKKIAGIKAWQEGEVSKIYLEISRESLGKGVPANQVINLSSSAGKTTLTAEEYQAVLELNRVLRY